MREPTFLILTALTERPLHGYGVKRAVSELSDGKVTLRAGTLYAALDRLVEERLLAVDREEVVDGRHRRYYKLTDAGGKALAAEVARMKHAADLAGRRLRAHGFGAA